MTNTPTLPAAFSLLHGDCLEKLATLRDNSIDAVVTDPPYGLGEAPDALAMLRDWLETGHHDVKSKRGFMGKTWDNFVPQPRVWHEVFRVLKPGGHVLAFAGTRTQDLMALGLRLAGFEIRDLVAWVYGSGFPKSHNLEGEWNGWGTALKPALEPITLARKPLEGTVAANVLKWHTGAINVDACRVPTSGEKLGGGAEKDVQSDKPEGWDRPWRNDPEAQKAHAERIRENVQKAEALGRWPANLIHDGSEEVVGLFPVTSSGGGNKSPTKPSTFNASPKHGRYAGGPNIGGDTGSASRFFYCAKVSPSERNAGLSDLPDKEWKADGAAIPQRADRPFKPSKNNHPTVKPIALMRYLCRLITPPSGTILDPYLGSGSTGVAALQEGFDFIGIEREEEYFAIASARIDNVSKP